MVQTTRPLSKNRLQNPLKENGLSKISSYTHKASVAACCMQGFPEGRFWFQHGNLYCTERDVQTD